jgi:hypothetical protein
MASPDIIQVQGLRELSRAFKVADKALTRDLRKSLRQAAEPVRSEAENLAVGTIRNIGVPWSRMRIGVTQSAVYLAPRERGRKTTPARRRPNLATLLLGRSMEPALAHNENEVVQRIDDMLLTVGAEWEAV